LVVNWPVIRAPYDGEINGKNKCDGIFSSFTHWLFGWDSHCLIGASLFINVIAALVSPGPIIKIKI
jgi:hypothetical protein